ncbi:hypothetical protein P691DRAFT_735633 [Macrolepiota fuliginosa MF-IS2]|uniref:F-box domain-containing protein n=1 Tax=Macrolepiota fuliginosa MF-IS2 TaxID=1400762 RepID=A0A9P6C155_9AGAR|nr:hypothetical protein P691DRAFT_735633 [Macrolepiota fuliginosa MF-IS2]
MTWPNVTLKSVYPPMFIAYDPGSSSIYDNWQRPEPLPLDIRLALEKTRKNTSPVSGSSSIDSPSQSLKRSLFPSRFKKTSPSRSPIQQAKQHNNEQIACRLPEEVYFEIFLNCAQLPLQSLENWGWTNVSYVCSNWRSTALRCRKLWAFIDFSSPARTAISLNRAKGEPLSIRAVVKQHNHCQVRNILNNAHQVHDIHLDSSFDDIQPLLETLAHPNPTLTSLVVNVASEGMLPPTYPRPDFPLFGQRLHLQTVELTGVPLYLLSYRCPSLTRLTIHDLPKCEHHADIFELLPNLPQLQYLTITRCAMHGEVPDRQIHLPHLQHLKVKGSLQQVADFLEPIILPSDCQLSCSLDQLDNLSESLWRFCQLIGAHSYTSSQDIPLETLILTCNEVSTRFTTSYDLNPDFRQSIRIRAFGPTAKPNCATFDISIGPGGQTIPDDIIITTLSGIWRALFLTGVQTLSLQNIDIVTQKTWTQFLRTLPQLRVLDIRGCAPSGLAWALLLDVLSSSASASRFLAPRLDDVYLHGVDCSSGGLMLSPKGQINSHADQDDSSFLDVLAACLKHRRRHKIRLRSLTVTRCEQVSEKTLEEVKQMVSHLVWDIRGKVKGETSARYRTMHLDTPRSDLRHYHRLEALLS